MYALERLGQEPAASQEDKAKKEAEDRKARQTILLIAVGGTIGVLGASLIPKDQPIKNFVLAVAGVLTGRGIINFFM